MPSRKRKNSRNVPALPDLPPPRSLTLPARRGHRGREESAITLSVHEAGAGPAVVLCHGFPELAYSWRHQIPALARAGFRVIAPDQRGYGASERPQPVDQYDLGYLTGDLVGLLDALDVEKAVFVGHDWGGFVAWAMPVLHPERTLGVIGVNTPYLPMPATGVMRMMAGGKDERLYLLWFQEPGVAEGVLDPDPRLLFEKLMRRGVDPEEAMRRATASGELDMNPFRRLEEFDALGEPLLTREELDVFVSSFEKTGFRGGINWYRNIDRNLELAPEIGQQNLDCPCLMVTAEWDLALRPEMASGMSARITDLETRMLEQCGHWTQQERPAELNGLMTDWLRRRFL